MDNNKITIKDIVSLALKGYSKDDIKELFTLAQQMETSVSNEGEQKTAAEGEPKVDPEPTAPEVKPEENPDNIEDIDELKKQITDLKGQLSNAQKANVTSPLPETGKETDQDILNDLARSFM